MKKLGLLTGMFIMIVFLCAGCKGQGEVGSTEEYDPYQAAETLTAVIRTIDLDAGTMSFLGISDGQQYDLYYNNGVDVRNKYDEIMSGTLLEPGEIVDLVYNTKNQKLLEIKRNKDAWEVQNLSGFELNRADKQAEILNQIYNYTNDLVVISDGKLIEKEELCSEDQLTARGYGGTLYSLTVELGHGYVKLEDYDTYIGGMIEIGYDVIVPVTEDMLLTVREGTYKLKITKGEHSGYKNVVVTKDEEATVSLRELQIAPDPVGMLYFDVTPSEARVMIDEETIDTSQTLELTYGRHQIRVTADGYETKQGYITVSAAYKIFTIELTRTDGETDESTGTTTGTTATITNTATTEAGAASTTEGDATTEAGGSVSTEAQATGNTVTIEKPIGAYCYVDGNYMGTVPVTFEKTAGSHVVTFSMKGCLAKSYTIQCQNNGKDDTYSFDALDTYDSILFED